MYLTHSCDFCCIALIWDLNALMCHLLLSVVVCDASLLIMLPVTVGSTADTGMHILLCLIGHYAQ